MVYRKQIGDFVFLAQTTFYMYVSGADKPILITSDRDVFNKQKRLAREGRIAARNKKK